jgi:hypothetical protein
MPLSLRGDAMKRRSKAGRETSKSRRLKALKTKRCVQSCVLVRPYPRCRGRPAHPRTERGSGAADGDFGGASDHQFVIRRFGAGALLLARRSGGDTLVFPFGRSPRLKRSPPSIRSAARHGGCWRQTSASRPGASESFGGPAFFYP